MEPYFLLRRFVGSEGCEAVTGPANHFQAPIFRFGPFPSLSDAEQARSYPELKSPRTVLHSDVMYLQGPRE
jgi:hypothetical protein